MSRMGIRSLHTYAKLASTPPQPYCDCPYVNRLDCQCGEADCTKSEWTWDENIFQRWPRLDVSIIRQMVTFHTQYSQGTAVVRGNKILTPGSVHYWEVKMLTSLTGTDTMIGFGTEQVDLCLSEYEFCSALGKDDQSYGFSYRGTTQHAGSFKYYSRKFTFGSIVGVYLDLFRGRVEFYLNRKPLSIAYSGLNLENRYYPMACSTSAKCQIKLMNSCSFAESLSLHCMKVISKYPSLVKQVQTYKHLEPVCRSLWFMLSPEIHEYSTSSNNDSYFDDCTATQDDVVVVRNQNDIEADMNDVSLYDIGENGFGPQFVHHEETVESSNESEYDSDGMHFLIL